MLKIAEKIKGLFSKANFKSEEFFEELCDVLIEGDVGPAASMEICRTLEDACKKEKIFSQEEILLKMKERLLPYAKEERLFFEEGKTNIWMLLGVNGVGKTTTAAKIARLQKAANANVILCAADTFRAGAIEQLSLHAKNLGVRVVSHQAGSDAAAVVFDAAESASSRGGGLVIADTAGRLHNKENLVRELQKIDRICREKASGGCYKKLLVVDATTGQNALRQAEAFNEAVGVSAVVLTKYDSTAKGGVVISIGKSLSLPVAFVCAGESYDDIEEFSSEKYLDEFLGL